MIAWPGPWTPQLLDARTQMNVAVPSSTLSVNSYIIALVQVSTHILHMVLTSNLDENRIVKIVL